MSTLKVNRVSKPLQGSGSCNKDTFGQTDVSPLTPCCEKNKSRSQLLTLAPAPPAPKSISNIPTGMADYEQLPLQLEPAADAPAIVGQLILRLLFHLSPLQHTVHSRTSTANKKREAGLKSYILQNANRVVNGCVHLFLSHQQTKRVEHVWSCISPLWACLLSIK